MVMKPDHARHIIRAAFRIAIEDGSIDECEPDEAIVEKAMQMAMAAPDLLAERDRLAAENKRLREALEDATAYIEGHVQGPAQRDGIVNSARAALSDNSKP